MDNTDDELAEFLAIALATAMERMPERTSSDQTAKLRIDKPRVYPAETGGYRIEFDLVAVNADQTETVPFVMVLTTNRKG